MWKKLGSFLGLFGASPQAAALPPVADPKVRRGPQSAPSFVKRGANTRGDQRLQENDRRVATTDLLTLRTATSTKEVIRNLAATSPDLSASVHSYIRLGVTRDFRAVARNQDGTANPEATAALQQVLNRFNYLQDFSQGFSTTATIHSVGEQLTKELRQYGSASLELVLDKSLMPSRLQPISTTQLVFHDDGKGGFYPVQSVSGNEIVLDTPAFFYESIDQDLLEAYSSSPLEAAVQPTIQDTEFTNDVRRIIKRALHPRIDVSIDFETFKKSIPLDIQGDPDLVRAYQDAYIAGIESGVNGLQPDDALVHFSMLKFDYLNNGNISLDREYDTLQSMINSKLASGAKAPPAVLGHGAGSQNIASTESLLFLRYCEGVQNKVNSLISRALTLALRLLGFDVFVEFSFDRVDLRPDSELEAFKSMKQSRVLDLLSLGLVTDEEASLALTGRLPPTGSPKLSGTFFRASAGSDPAPTNVAVSGTSQSTFGKATQPETPTQPKGSQRKSQ